MKAWFERPACRQHAACIDCRTSRAFRETIFAKGQVESADFACPHGIDETTAQAAFEGRVTAVFRKKGCGTCAPVAGVVPEAGVEPARVSL